MVLEVVGAILFVVLKPFSLFKLSCIAALRGISVVIDTWVEVLSAAIYLHASIFWRFVVWTISLVTLPLRALVALRREKQLEVQLRELQNRFEALAWDRMELQEHLQIAIEEQAMMESMLGELEEEHNQAIHKIELLEAELQVLKDENHRLNEAHGKSCWDTASLVLAGNGRKFMGPNNNKSVITLTNILMSKDTSEDENKYAIGAGNFIKAGGEDPIQQIIPGFMTGEANSDDILEERREFAFWQTLFSALLSLVVGIILWEADDPCMPLVLALFTVVGMSLKSVVQFLFTIRNKPPFDAVALLSLNWFILGTLTYPMLPRIAPIYINLLERALRWFGSSFLLS